MSNSPYLSVVMSVYNDADQLGKSIQSILDQTYEDFEFIIINDGSTDRSQSVLKKFEQNDTRITIIKQPNQGLTKSLITGCNHASGKYIARQDVGDYSYPRRLEKQIEYFEDNPNCTTVFCYFKVVNESGIVISQHQPSITDIEATLDFQDGNIATPSHHGCAMFNREIYLQAGGYRQEFYFAQDLDLWLRMSEYGEIYVVDEMLYNGFLSSNTISGKFHRLQKKYHDIIIESARIRKIGGSEQTILNDASKIGPTTNPLFLNISKSNTLYFMASCLLSEQPKLAKSYLKQAISINPINLKAWYKLIFKT